MKWKQIRDEKNVFKKIIYIYMNNLETKMKKQIVHKFWNKNTKQYLKQNTFWRKTCNTKYIILGALYDGNVLMCAKARPIVYTSFSHIFLFYISCTFPWHFSWHIILQTFFRDTFILHLNTQPPHKAKFPYCDTI